MGGCALKLNLSTFKYNLIIDTSENSPDRFFKEPSMPLDSCFKKRFSTSAFEVRYGRR